MRGPAAPEASADFPPEAPPDCPRCPRLAAYRHALRAAHPDWFNDPVPSFGPATARLAIVGLAPGLGGANRTGRPFTGDHAGGLLYAMLARFGFSAGHYDARPDDGLVLRDCLITNAVRCVPPQNRPTGAEIATCRPFLAARLEAMPDLRAALALGRIAHDSLLAAHGLRRAAFPFGHGAVHDLPNGLRLFDSFHCSRQNTNTGRLTPEMFAAIFAAIRAWLDTTDPT